MEMSRLTRDGTAETVSRDQILKRNRVQGNIHFPCSAEHEQDWQPYPVDPYSCYTCDHTSIHIRGCQSVTYFAGQENIRGTYTNSNENIKQKQGKKRQKEVK